MVKYKSLMDIPEGTLIVREGAEWVRTKDHLDDGESIMFEHALEGGEEFFPLEEINSSLAESAPEKEQGFTLKDLVAGKHLVKTRDGGFGIIVITGGEKGVLFSDNQYMEFDDQTEDLKYPLDDKLDIIEVFEINTIFLNKLFFPTESVSIWKEPEAKKKMTYREIADVLGYEFEMTGETE